MSEKNHLDTAEDSLRQAIISCLNNKKDGRKVMMVPASDFEDIKSCVSMDLDEYDYLRDHDDAT